MAEYTITKELREVMDRSIICYVGMNYTYFDEIRSFEYENWKYDLHDGEYCYNNGVIGFVVNETLYAAWSCDSVYSAITNTLTKGEFFVPFSNGEVPQAEAGMWLQLHARAKSETFASVQKSAREYCDAEGIKEIPDYILKNCFRIPRLGMETTREGFMAKSHCLGISWLETKDKEMLGTYTANNGVVVFIDRNGVTYTAHGYGIIDILKEAGYREGEMWVPFSNGEAPKNDYYRSLWENLENF